MLLSPREIEKLSAAVRVMERTGKLAEARREATAEDDAKRKQLVSELAVVGTQREQVLPVLKAVVEKTEIEFRELQTRLGVVLTRHCEAASAAHGAEYELDRKAFVLRRQLLEIAPEILSDVDIKFQRLIDRLRAAVTSVVAINPTGPWGSPTGVRVSQADQIAAITKDIEAQRRLLEVMTFSADDAATIEARCQAMIAEVRAKAATILSRAVLAEILGEEPEPAPALSVATRGKRTAA